MKFEQLPLSKKLLLLVFTLLLGLSLAAGLSHYQNNARQVTWLESEGCQLNHSACLYDSNPYGQAPIKLSLVQSSAITPMSALRLHLDWPGMKADRLNMALTGADMYMGEVRFALQKQSSGSYETSIYLPVCTTGAMTWRGEIVPVLNGVTQTLMYGLTFELTSSQ